MMKEGHEAQTTLFALSAFKFHIFKAPSTFLEEQFKKLI